MLVKRTRCFLRLETEDGRGEVKSHTLNSRTILSEVFTSQGYEVTLNAPTN